MRSKNNSYPISFNYILVILLLISSLLQFMLQPMDDANPVSVPHGPVWTQESGIAASTESNTSENQTSSIQRLVMTSISCGYLSLRMVRLVFNKLGFNHSCLGEHFQFLNPHSIYIHSITPRSNAVIMSYIHCQIGEKHFQM